MKIIFESQSEKKRIIEVARKSPLETVGKFYINLLEESPIEGEEVKPQQVEEDLVDENIPQITL